MMEDRTATVPVRLAAAVTAAAPDGLVPPYGGALVDCGAAGAEATAALARARELPAVSVGARALADLELLAAGAYSPLAGFMDEATYRAVVDTMRLPSGLVWPLPVVLDVAPELWDRAGDGSEFALLSGPGRPLALLRVEDRFRRDLGWEARHVFGTDDPAHPGVARLLAESPLCLSGPVTLFDRRVPDFPRLALDPRATRAAFRERGWRRVAAFQTRNPVHRAHEYLQKCALEITDGLLLHPLVGSTKDDDVPAPVRIRSYEELVRLYYPAGRVVLAAFPAAMRYAGPREAVFHAICRRNYGCSHFIVGRDHAGVGGHYGPFDAQRLVESVASDIGVVPLCFDNAFFCRRCGSMATVKTCPHDERDHVSLSGTRVREMLRCGTPPPPEFTRPEVARLLAAAAADSRNRSAERGT